MSCASAGNCSAGGYYIDGSGHQQAFVVSEANGTWQPADEVPGTAPSTRAGAPRSPRCRVPRRATAAPAGPTPTAPATSRRSWPARSNGTWGTAERGARHRRPQPGRERRGRLGVVRLGGQLQRRRVLHRQLRPPAGVRGQRDQRHLGHRPRRCPAPPPSTRAGTPTSTRCRVPRRATAAPAGPTPTAPATSRRSWPTRPTAPGARPRRCPAPRPSTRAGTPRSSRCRVPRRATAAPAGTTSTAPARAGVRGQRDRRHLGHGRGGARHRRPQPGGIAAIESVSCASAGNCSAGGDYPDGSGHSAGVRGQRGRRHLGHRPRGPGTAALNHGGTPASTRCRARRRATAARAGTTPTAPATSRRSWSARPTAPGAPPRGARHRRPQPGRRRRHQLGVVRLGGQLQRRRVLHRQLRPPAGVRGQQDVAPGHAPGRTWFRHEPSRDGHGAASTGAQQPAAPSARRGRRRPLGAGPATGGCGAHRPCTSARDQPGLRWQPEDLAGGRNPVACPCWPVMTGPRRSLGEPRTIRSLGSRPLPVVRDPGPTASIAEVAT